MNIIENYLYTVILQNTYMIIPCLIEHVLTYNFCTLTIIAIEFIRLKDTLAFLSGQSLVVTVFN